MEKITYSVELKFKVTGDKGKIPSANQLDDAFRTMLSLWEEKVPLNVSEVDVTIT